MLYVCVGGLLGGVGCAFLVLLFDNDYHKGLKVNEALVRQGRGLAVRRVALFGFSFVPRPERGGISFPQHSFTSGLSQVCEVRWLGL